MIRRFPRLHIVFVCVALLVNDPASADDPAKVRSKPLSVIVWGGGTWIEVEMVEERNGSIVYQKAGGVPTAATEHSVDADTTDEVNDALADLFDACNGRTADPRSMFELEGRSRRIFFSVANKHQGDCLRRLHQQYEELQRSPQPPPDTGSVSYYARDHSLKTGSEGSVVVDNADIGAAAGARYSDYRAVLDDFERVVEQVEDNVRVALDRMALFQDKAWMTENYAMLDRLARACDNVRQVSPPPAGKVFHTMVVSTIGEIDEINATIRKGFETGKVSLLYDALPEIEWRMEKFDEHSTKVYETYRSTGETSTVFSISDLYGNPDELIAAKCRTEWPNEPSMEMRCVEEQEKALKRLRARTNRSAGVWSYTFDDIREECRLEWPSDFVNRDNCEVTRLDTHIAIHGKKEW